MGEIGLVYYLNSICDVLRASWLLRMESISEIVNVADTSLLRRTPLTDGDDVKPKNHVKREP